LDHLDYLRPEPLYLKYPNQENKIYNSARYK